MLTADLFNPTEWLLLNLTKLTKINCRLRWQAKATRTGDLRCAFTQGALNKGLNVFFRNTPFLSRLWHMIKINTQLSRKTTYCRTCVCFTCRCIGRFSDYRTTLRFFFTMSTIINFICNNGSNLRSWCLPHFGLRSSFSHTGFHLPNYIALINAIAYLDSQSSNLARKNRGDFHRGFFGFKRYQ